MQSLQFDSAGRDEEGKDQNEKKEIYDVSKMRG